MGREYFSQRQGARTPREREFDDELWTAALRPYLRQLEDDGQLIMAFPEACPDGLGHAGLNEETLRARMLMGLGYGDWPLPQEVPSKAHVFDYVEFFYEHIETPEWGTVHGFFGHTHVDGGDRENARANYRRDLNTAFARLGYRYQLTIDGRIIRLTDEAQDRAIFTADTAPADPHLRELLDRAVSDFFDRGGERKAQALDAIVDAFERTKTLEDDNKVVSIPLTLAKISDQPGVRTRIETEMRELTEIGNSFEIRHHEVAQIPIQNTEIVDYLFYRYYNLVRSIVRHYPGA